MEKKAYIFDWYGDIKEFNKITGYDHNSEVPHDKVWKIAKKLFNKGFSVQLQKHSDNAVTLYVSKTNFKQR